MQTIQLQGHTHTLCVPLSVFLHGPPTAPPETGERPFLFSVVAICLAKMRMKEGK